jgi:class 3 adenylate cyclase
LKIQTELIELYDGKIEYIINNKILSSFIGEDSIDKSLQCSLAIMKLINKESNSSKYKIGIGINYGSIFYGGEKASLSGETVELAESIVDISKPGQILINNELISKTDFKYSVAESKNWKFKNMKKDIKLVNISGEMKE